MTNDHKRQDINYVEESDRVISLETISALSRTEENHEIQSGFSACRYSKQQLNCCLHKRVTVFVVFVCKVTKYLILVALNGYVPYSCSVHFL